MDALIARIDAAVAAMWVDRPADVERMVGRNYDTGKEFSVWTYTWGYLGNLADQMYEYAQMGRAGEGDLATLRALAARQCRRYAGSLEHTAHMEDAKAVLEAVADGFEGTACGDHATFAVLANKCQRYLRQLSFWVDIELPWAAVSELVDARWHE